MTLSALNQHLRDADTNRSSPASKMPACGQHEPHVRRRSRMRHAVSKACAETRWGGERTMGSRGLSRKSCSHLSTVAATTTPGRPCTTCEGSDADSKAAADSVVPRLACAAAESIVSQPLAWAVECTVSSMKSSAKDAVNAGVPLPSPALAQEGLPYSESIFRTSLRAEKTRDSDHLPPASPFRNSFLSGLQGSAQEKARAEQKMFANLQQFGHWKASSTNFWSQDAVFRNSVLPCAAEVSS